MSWWWAIYAVAGAVPAAMTSERVEVAALLLAAHLVPLLVVMRAGRATGRAFALRVLAAPIVALAAAVGAAVVLGAHTAAAALGAFAWAVAAIAWLRSHARARLGAQAAEAATGVTWFVASVVGAAAAASAASLAGTWPAAVYTLVGLLVALAISAPVSTAGERIDDALAALRRTRRRRIASLARTVQRRFAGTGADVADRAAVAVDEITAIAASAPDRADAALAALAEIAAALVEEAKAPGALVRVLAAEHRIGGGDRLCWRLRRAGASPVELAAALRVVLPSVRASGEAEAAAREAVTALLDPPRRLRRAAEIVRRALHNRFKHGRAPAAGHTADATAPLTADAARGLEADLSELARCMRADLFASDRAALAAAAVEPVGHAAAAAAVEAGLTALAGLLWIDVAPAIEAATAALAGDRRLEVELSPEVLILAAPLPLRPLRDALDNLLWNAMQASRVRVHVRGRVRAGHLEIDVGDDGPGLDAAGLERARARGGGLTIASLAAEQAGGELALAPAPDGGGVRLRLPLV